jgi:excisionase family DNA binding protein
MSEREQARRQRQREASLASPPLAMTAKQVADELQIGLTQVYAAVACGAIPSVRIGKRIVIPRAGIEAMLAKASA